MKSDINNVVLSGNLVRDPVRKEVGKSSVTNFDLASHDTYNKDGMAVNTTMYMPVSAWGALGDSVAQFKKKGDPVIVVGNLQQESWEQDGQNRSRISLRANAVKFLPSGNGKPEQAETAARSDKGARTKREGR